MSYRAPRRTHLGARALLLAAAATAAALAARGAPMRVQAPGATAPTMTFDADGLRQQNLAVRYSGGYPQYRIPALAVTTDGTLIAAYDARPSMHDLPSHIAIAVRRSTDGGKTWGPQRIIREAPAPAGFGDASLLVDQRTGRIFLFYAAAVNEGYVGSHTGSAPGDPNAP